jgi:soluble lytic murein transglycosylase-like protein
MVYLVCMTLLIHIYFSLSVAHSAGLEGHILGAARVHKLRPCLIHAVLKLESNGKLDAVNRKTHDYGLMQINKKTAAAYGLTLARLTIDAKYNIEAGALVMADIRDDYEKREPLTWVCRYNVGYGPLHGRRLVRCARYLQLLQPHLNLCPKVLRAPTDM